jgi:hypothetical protein
MMPGDAPAPQPEENRPQRFGNTTTGLARLDLPRSRHEVVGIDGGTEIALVFVLDAVAHANDPGLWR